MANSLDFCTKLAPELDKLLTKKSAAAFLEDRSLEKKFIGAKTVMLPDITLTGLGTYNRTAGFPQGNITVDQKSYTLSMDRGASFVLDRIDEDETGIAGLAGQVSGEFVRTKAVPEVDAYVFSKAYSVADENSNILGNGENGTSSFANTCYSILNEGINSVIGAIGDDEEIVAFCDNEFYSALLSTTELERRLEIGNFKKGEIDTQVKTVNGVALIRVPTARMKTSYTFNSGESEFGFEADADAKNIGLIVMPKAAIKLIKKTEKIRHFTPDQNPDMDAHKIDYRLVYDALVKSSYANTVFAYTYQG